MNESRKQFEAAAANKLNFDISTVIASRDGDSYDSKLISDWYGFWQASRAAIEIELPSRKAACASGYGDGYLVDSLMGDALEYDETVEAIRAAGIKVKE